jgi:hypothetical protein
MSKTPAQTPAAGPIDIKELLSVICSAEEACASATMIFTGLCAIFEAIGAASPRGSLTSRLACLGGRLCEEADTDFMQQQEMFDGHRERFEDTVFHQTEIEHE